MSILFHTTFANEKEWFDEIKKKFKKQKIYKISDKPDFKEIEFAIIWNLPNNILSKLENLKIIFSLGAGVDHILKLTSYNKTPIVRLNDPNMAIRMAYHVLSQILNYQLKLNIYQKAQHKKKWLSEIEPLFNNQIQVGILGLGYLGTFVGKYLKKLNYNVIGYKKSLARTNTTFPIYTKRSLDKFIKTSDIIVSILPFTDETTNLIDLKFLKKMKRESLLINVGRGESINEKELIKHMKSNYKFFVSLDVFKKEPLPKNHPFWKLPNVTITPHVASLSVINSAIKHIYKRLVHFQKSGKITSDVDLKKGY